MFEGDNGYVGIEGTSTLTLSPGASITGKTGRVGPALFVGGISTLVNQGLIRCDVTGGTITINPNVFTNTGTLESSNGGVVVVNPGTSWTQNGTVRAGPGAVRLGGALTGGSAGTLLTAGGTIEISGTFDLGGSTLTLNDATGPLLLNGGGLSNGAVVQSGAGRLRFTSSGQNILDGIALTGDLALTESSARARVRNGLAITGGLIRLSNNGGVGFEGDQTFAGEILFEGDSGYVGIEGTSTLTLGPTALVHGKTGRVGQALFVGGNATLVNQGTIRCDVSGGTITVNPASFTNAGTIESINGGIVAVSPTSWSQSGTLRTGPGVIRMGGNLLGGSLGTLVGAGGSLELAGAMNLQGGTLALNDSTGPLTLTSGLITNGVVAQAGAGRLQFNSSGQNILDSVQISGDLDLTASSARVRIRNGLVMASGRVRLSNNGGIGFEGDQTFSGEIVFEGDNGYVGIEGSSTLTLGPTAVVRGKSGRVGPALFVGGTTRLVNQGVIRSDVAGGTITVNPNEFTNNGTVESLNGGTVNVTPGSLAQAGTLRAGPGTIRVGGTITGGSLGTRVNNGGTLELNGALDLGGGVLALTPATGPLLLVNGSIANGSITQSGTGVLQFNSSGQNVLDGISVTGDLVLVGSSPRVRIRTGLTLVSGIVRIGNNGGIGFEGNQTFAGEIVFEGDSGYVGIEGNSTLTLGPAALIHGKTGRVGPALFVGGTSVLVNQGTIRADVAGGAITVNPSTFTNTGVLDQVNGGRLIAPGFP